MTNRVRSRAKAARAKAQTAVRIVSRLGDRDIVRRYSQRAWVEFRRRGVIDFMRFVYAKRNLLSSSRSYGDWVSRCENDLASRVRELADWSKSLQGAPLISVLMPVHNTPRNYLEEAIESVCSQVYPHWELCIVDDASKNPDVKIVLDFYASRDGRIKVVHRSENGHISRATNDALALASGDWIALLDHDDILRPHALAEVAQEIMRDSSIEVVYSDEDKIDGAGKRYDPYFKPDFSHELFRSQNYLNHLTVHRADNVRKVGGWRVGYEGSQDYDLNLRIIEHLDARKIRHIPKVLYHWRAVEGSTALNAGEKNYAVEAGRRALQEHAQRQKLNVEVEFAPNTPFYRFHFRLPPSKPLVSLIIPTRDNAALLRNCIQSIGSKTSYRNYEIIIVNNGSISEESLLYLDFLRGLENVKVLDIDIPFNYSRLNNIAVEYCRGEILGLLNDDVEIINPEWLTEMVSWAAQDAIGCVGAKLYYADGRIQHAGVITGLGGVAGHSHKFFGRDEPGYFYRLKVLQNVSAVTGACLVIRKHVYAEVGGLDEVNLPVAFNDVDLCLKVGEAGYRNVWTPYAELYHLESVSRGSEDNPEKVRRFQSEIAYMKKRWKLSPDPFYSPNLTLDSEDFGYSF
ncbi:O-antigen biosynthesis protein [Nitratireductor aquimarinus]|uniref:glycosyltransferase family 2 protein n=1 Tax=Nitratireductor aquimarinus TaxID=889300 RepID=UPI003B5C363B